MRIAKKALLLAVQRGVTAVDVFSTTLYTGNGSTQTITNGIDLAGEGGLVWQKARSAASSNFWTDTERGATNYIASNLANAEAVGNLVISFNNDGFTEASGFSSGTTLASWTFRQAPKFFDIVQYTGDGTNGRQIAHDLGVAPGMITTKSLSTTGDWNTYHRSATGDMKLNTTAAQAASKTIVESATDSTFTVSGVANSSGVTYIAYLFAHDPSDSGIIQCGSFDVSGTGSDKITTGWPVQYLLFKYATRTGDWEIGDTKRTPSWLGDEGYLEANNSNAEALANFASNEADGVTLEGFTAAGETVIYMAIRAPE